ncbi:MAG: dockerin type I repeat-containing protein, partial [Ruminococcus sp.]|nr:dockerin type I repeat-containing protein [Ruminococcus sp.]
HNSIAKYYPDTKIANSEYNFGGGNYVSATIAQAEALGCYADMGVYFATLWGGESFIFSGINLYTNYDGNGGSFGDTLVPTVTDDVSLSSSYASVNKGDDGLVTAMITNKSMTDSENASVVIKNSGKDYKSAAVYAVYGESEEIRLIDIIDNVEDNIVNVELPAFSAAMVVISDDASEFDGLQTDNGDKTVQNVVTFDNPESMINGNGFVEIPIEDPEHLKKLIITADVTSSAGSSWGTAGCAVSINAVDKESNKFWTSMSYSLVLGKNSTAEVKFDGTLSNKGEDVEAVIADGKVELQKWWDSSEKQESEIEDIITVKYTNVQVVYEYDAEMVEGDVNGDGLFNTADIVAMYTYLIGAGKLRNPSAGDLCKDNRIDTFDLVVMRQMLLNK